jgi:hypothetical protein
MRFLVLLALLPLCPACKLLHKGSSADAGAEAAAASASEAPSATGAPADSASAAASASPTAPAHAVPHYGPAAAGTPCPTRDATACAADGFEELTCSAGIWHVLQTCRGAGGCKAEGGSVKCDPGVPRAGDACVAASAVPRCTDPRSVLQCENGRWTSSLCLPPSKCQPNAKNGQPGCK